MPKLLILIQLDGDTVGGAQKRYLNVINYLLREQDDFYIVLNSCLYRNAINEGLLTPNGRIHSIDLKTKCKTSIKTVSDKKKEDESNTIIDSRLYQFLGQAKYILRLHTEWIRFAWQLVPFLFKNKIDTVYSIWYGGIWIWPLKYIKKFKLIYSFNDSGYSSIHKGWYNWLFSEYFILKKADTIDFLSFRLIKGVRDKGVIISDKRIGVTPNSFIDFSKLYPSSRKENKIVFLGRISPIKNPLLLLNAILPIDDFLFSKKFSVHIYGHGPQEIEVNAFIRENNLRSVFFHGSINEPWLVLNNSKIFISIQERENYPSQALMESMVAGNVPIVSDVGETRKMVTEEEGVLVSLDRQSISEAIISLVNNSEVIYQKSLQARKKGLDEFSIEKYMKYFNDLTINE